MLILEFQINFMPRKKKEINAKVVLKLSKIFVALSILFAPIITFWKKPLPDFVNFEFVTKSLIACIYIIILYFSTSESD